MIMAEIYLIDDEPELVSILGEIVKRSGLSFDSYTHAALFLERLHEVQADAIVILDLMMPDIDGIEVMRKLAELDRPPRLILISGSDKGVLHSAEELGRAQNLRVLGSIAKPLDMKRFVKLLTQFGTAVEEPTGGGFDFKQSVTSSELHHGILNNQMVLHYQPQIRISDGLPIGVEALVRWQHPELGLLMPNCFVQMAEQGNLIDLLTQKVLGAAVEQRRDWLSQGLMMGVSVNISSRNVTSLTFPEQMARMLIENQLDPGGITLEVTETELMEELTTSLDILTRLRLKGIRLSIDDFGTGYSSLLQLHRAPFSELKIDRSFVSKMHVDDEAKSIVETCVTLGKKLKMSLVAEGVEDRATLDLLAALGCDLAQGYHIARPMPGDEMSVWLKEHG